ncbi:unnamed protein product [Oikopleura dioica]|uniref:Uncharacterized protein n=1 Tax=Oikopleura dioica TaxID=34765 RepID=E4YAR6_OIKDI|nr:unnamed protein product [Oikopleura dioica]
MLLEAFRSVLRQVPLQQRRLVDFRSAHLLHHLLLRLHFHLAEAPQILLLLAPVSLSVALLLTLASLLAEQRPPPLQAVSFSEVLLPQRPLLQPRSVAHLAFPSAVVAQRQQPRQALQRLLHLCSRLPLLQQQQLQQLRPHSSARLQEA